MLVTAVAVVVAPAAAHAASGWIYLVNVKTGKALQGLTTAKSLVVQRRLVKSQPQEWLVVNLNGSSNWMDGDVLGFRNAGTSSQYGLAISQARTDNGAPAILWDYLKYNAEQQWVMRNVIVNVLNSPVYLQNMNSGKCLAIAAGSSSDSAKVIQWPCNGGQDQQWRMQLA